MSVRYGVLALLAECPRYGYEVRTAFEARTGGTWPLNVGQVYTTLARLERDALVIADGADDAGPQYYAVTDDGRAELRRWFTTPVRREDRPRDELAIKLALAVAADVDVSAVIQAQRSDTLRAMQDYTRLKVRTAESADPGDLAFALVLEAMVFQAEAEVRWLDHCEARLAQVRPAPAGLPAAAPAPVRSRAVR
ncbi:MAG: PadR family transcriptional regulator [Frankiales bacterium]|nr:PadR family transcriptional regulator [Frankiales bacterium]